MLLPLAVLVAVAWMLRPVELHRTEMGQGSAFGGVRSVAAGACWLRADLAWERRDAKATAALVNLTVAADPRPSYFWLNGARMMACDFPAWRAGTGLPSAVGKNLGRDDAHAAVEFIARGRWRHRDDPAFPIELAVIRWRNLGDRAGAAQLFREAAELSAAPPYAGRLHAELLGDLGRRDEALAWLRRTLPRLPAGDPAARRDVVVQRIKALEAELNAR